MTSKERNDQLCSLAYSIQLRNVTPMYNIKLESASVFLMEKSGRIINYTLG